MAHVLSVLFVVLLESLIIAARMALGCSLLAVLTHHPLLLARTGLPPACLPQVHDGTNTPLNQFLKDPDSLITRVTWKDEQDKVRLQ
jgi:hypothetical protein